MNNEKITATYCICNFGGLVVLGDVKYGINDKLTTAFDFGEGIKNKRTTRIFYTLDDDARPYVKRYGVKYFLDEMMRV